MMTRGTWICDGCDVIVNLAHVIPFKVPDSPRGFTFAFCKKCDRIDIHKRVFTEAAKEWSKKNKTP